MKIYLYAVLTVTLAGCASPAPVKPIGGKGYLPEHVRHAEDLEHHDDDILVLNPPANYVENAKSLGLKLVEVTELSELGMKLYHMRIDTDHHPLHFREIHEARFPGVIVDVHHHFGMHAAKVDKKYTGRGAAKWGQAAPGCGKGLKIGMLDSAVAKNHAAFTGKKIISKSFILKGQKESNREHGTAVASVLVGEKSWGGMLPDATLYSAGVFHLGAKNRARASSKSILHALEWMAKLNVDVVNISLGGALNKLVQEVVKAANAKGIVIIAAVGNDGPFTKKRMYPAAYEEVIGIAAQDRFNRTARFSSKGDYVEFSAPGVDIWSAIPKGGKPMSGTSFASPIATGIAAAGIKYKNIQGVEGVRKYLKSLATDRGKKGWDKFTGWGSIAAKPPC